MIGIRRVVLIRRLRRVVTGVSLDTNRFANGSRPISVDGGNTISVGGDGRKSMSAAGAGSKFILVGGGGVNFMFAVGAGENSTSVDGGGDKSTSVAGDGVRSMSAAGGKPTSADGLIVAIFSGVTGVTTVGGIIDTNAGGNKFMSTNAGGNRSTFMSVGGNCAMSTSAGGSLGRSADFWRRLGGGFTGSLQHTRQYPRCRIRNRDRLLHNP